MHYKIIPRRVSLLIYDDSDPIKYTASCQININGTYATLDTLNGKDFYKFLMEKGLQPFLDLGITEVRALITKQHLRLLKKVMSAAVVIKEEDSKSFLGIDFVWVSMVERDLSEKTRQA